MGAGRFDGACGRFQFIRLPDAIFRQPGELAGGLFAGTCHRHLPTQLRVRAQALHDVSR